MMWLLDACIHGVLILFGCLISRFYSIDVSCSYPNHTQLFNRLINPQTRSTGYCGFIGLLLCDTKAHAKDEQQATNIVMYIICL